MPGSKVKIGPWTAGINLRLNEDLIGETHLREALNFDVDDDGTLIARRAMRRYALPVGGVVLGSVSLSSGDPSYRYAVVQAGSTFYYTNTVNAGWLTAAYTLTPAMLGAVPYNNRIYYVPAGDQTVFGGYYATDFSGVLTPIPTMPAAKTTFIFKDRLFTVNDTRISYSKATDPTVWAAPDGGFFDVNPGDGDVITSVVIQNNSLIIFKKYSTYVFTYSTDPTVDGFLRTISQDTGAFATAVFNNEVYTVNDRSVFKFINLYYQDIGQAIDLKYSSGVSLTPTLHIIDQTLILLTSGTNGFAMNLINGSWSRYSYDFDFTNTLSSVRIYDGTMRATLFRQGYYIDHYRAGANTLDTGLVSAVLKTVKPHYRFKTRSYVQFQLGRYIIGDEAEWKKMYWWALHGVEPVAGGTPTLEIDRVAQSLTDAAPVGRVSTKSARFRRINMGYDSPAAQVALPLTTNVGPWFNRITLYMAPKATIEV